MPGLPSIQVVALQVALQNEEPGITFINESLDKNLNSVFQEFITTPFETVAFVPAAEINEPSLQLAISRADFSKQRLIAEDGKCSIFDVETLKMHLPLNQDGEESSQN